MITQLIRQDYLVVGAFTGVNSIRNKILKRKAAVVIDDEQNSKFIGLLTVDDIVKRPHQLVIDCMTPKPSVKYNCYLKEALEIMIAHQTEVLPVLDQESLKGIVFKDDILKTMSHEKDLIKKCLKVSREFLDTLSFSQSHHLRKPMANIIGLGELMRMTDITEEQKEILKMMTASIEEADIAIKQLQMEIEEQRSSGCDCK